MSFNGLQRSLSHKLGTASGTCLANAGNQDCASEIGCLATLSTAFLLCAILLHVPRAHPWSVLWRDLTYALSRLLRLACQTLVSLHADTLYHVLAHPSAVPGALGLQRLLLLANTTDSV